MVTDDLGKPTFKNICILYTWDSHPGLVPTYLFCHFNPQGASIMHNTHRNECHYAGCHYPECYDAKMTSLSVCMCRA